MNEAFQALVRERKGWTYVTPASGRPEGLWIYTATGASRFAFELVCRIQVEDMSGEDCDRLIALKEACASERLRQVEEGEAWA